MTKKYLNGKITISSFSTPSIEDLNMINALSDDERRFLLNEVLEQGEDSPISDKSVDEIWHSAMKKADEITKGEAKHAI